MSNKCQVTHKGPMSGNNVSHSRRRTKRRFLPNVMAKRFWIPSENRMVRLKVSAQGIRLIDKLGIEAVLERMKSERSQS